MSVESRAVMYKSSQKIVFILASFRGWLCPQVNLIGITKQNHERLAPVHVDGLYKLSCLEFDVCCFSGSGVNFLTKRELNKILSPYMVVM